MRNESLEKQLETVRQARAAGLSVNEIALAADARRPASTSS
jgi:hypothetical protein